MAVLKLYFHALAPKFNLLRFCTGADCLGAEQPHSARPFFHSFIRLDNQDFFRVIPLEPNPNRLPVRAGQITRAFTIIIVKREFPIRAGKYFQRRWLSYRLGNILSHRMLEFW